MDNKSDKINVPIKWEKQPINNNTFTQVVSGDTLQWLSVGSSYGR